MRSIERSVDAVCFDFGGVIVNGPFDAFTALELRNDVAVGAVRAINSLNPDTNAWARIERGEIDRAEFARLFELEASEIGHQLPGAEVIDIVWGGSPARAAANPLMIEAIEQCRAADIRLALITNNVQPMSGATDAEWLYELFDVVLESCVIGMRKPETEIYRSALQKLGVDANRALMLDDLGLNLKPARALGMRTIKVTDPNEAAAELIALIR
jgi:putative hydrolase of the HAD superfamily